MSTTRNRPADDTIALDQERYMSSPEYAELRGVMANAATAKAAITQSARKRSLIFFLQALSLGKGGLRAVAESLFEMFPERIGTKTMVKERVRSGAKLTDAQLEKILSEMNPDWCIWQDSEAERQATRARDIAEAERDPAYHLECCRNVQTMIEFLIDLCINPHLLILDPQDKSDNAALEHEKDEVYKNFQPRVAWQATSFKKAELPRFHDICGALFEYQARYTAAARDSYAPTSVTKKIHETLEAGLKTRRMVVIEGESDAGKTTACQAWCRMHKGEARYVQLPGLTNRTIFFRAIARELGIASSYTRTAKEMQARVEDVLQRSGLMLVLDESQYAFAQSERIYSRPEMIDWIYTTCCNYGVPVALVGTPLFSTRLNQAQRQVSWNSAQFRRRVYRFVELKGQPSRADIDLVVKHHLPDASAALHRHLAGYASRAAHPFTAISDSLADAGLIAEANGRQNVTLADLEQAIKDFRYASELAKREAFDKPAPKRGRKPSAPVMQEQCGDSADEQQDAESGENFTGRSRPVAALKMPETRNAEPVISQA